MLTQREHVIPTPIQEEMKQSYLLYSMSTIVVRALPDVRDGLKPSQRRILVAMNDLNLTPGRQHRKCAKISGDTSGNYHPHGEAIVYPTLVRMAQSFNMRYPLVDPQGNFGSIDGDPPAAMRYTEARMAAPAVEMLADLEKDTVDLISNYDETRQEPAVLPGRFPNLVCNGSSGIAVGMATNIPPHNLREVADAVVALIKNAELTNEDLLKVVEGPDFPTGGIIYGYEGVRNAYLTGRGLIRVRARATIETLKNGRENIIITEIPYQVNKTNLIEQMAALVRSRRVEGVSDLRDESDRDGMRIVVELKRDAYPEVVLNHFFKHTQLETTFGTIMLALVDGQPRLLTLKGLLSNWIDHRQEVIVRRTQYDLDRAERRAHILEGLKIALDHLDRVIEIIRASEDQAAARTALVAELDLTETQANAILDMRLGRLTGLERRKVEEDLAETLARIEEYRGILASVEKQMGIVKDDVLDLKRRFGDSRRTQIVPSVEEISIEDLIAEEDMVITISHAGYVKRQPVNGYRSQHRGGRGITGTGTKEEDFVEHLFITSTHSYILCFTNLGRCYWLKVYEIPQGGRQARGRPMINLLQLQPQENIQAILPVRSFDEGRFVVMATRRGQVKKTPLADYSRPRSRGVNAIMIIEGDDLVDVQLTDGNQDIALCTKSGKAIRFNERDVRPMGRSTRGVRGIRLEGEDEVVDLVVVHRAGTLLVVCENGYGKRSEIDDYRVTGRGGKGIITVKANERNGPVVAMREVVDDDQFMVITQRGVLIRMRVREVSVIGRNTQGVRLINLDDDDRAIAVARLAAKEEDEAEGDGADGEGAESGDGEAAALGETVGVAGEEAAAGDEGDDLEGADAEA
jgi:DNA gyrase subunit A